MSLTPGTRLGPYEVTAQIGAGGMGEVYRAADTNLKRSVAIKVLPESVAGDRERLARFQREAEVLAALNHPHIAAIYGVEKSDGQTALVMELVEGPTLADRIAQGALPLDEALPIAKQIAEALEAAHEQSIIHRDLKPANIKVREDGTVKVLDFGLAKVLEPTGAPAPGTSQLPTITSPAMTQAGLILGTAAYMSPEQARGKSADKRADIWAFGCVLYEMLTGRPAFDGEGVTDVLAAVVRAEPDWTRLPERTPPKVRDLLHRCLQKDRTLRMRDAGDARLEVQEALAAPGLGTVPALADGLPALARRPFVLALGSWLLGAVVAGVAFWGLKPAPAPRPVSRFSVILSDIQVLPSVAQSSVAISPDGSRLAYVVSQRSTAQPELYLRSMDSLESRPIPDTEGAFAPFFSPDGQWVGFFAGGRLKKVSVNGGAAVTLCNAASALGGSWGSQGTIVFGTIGPLMQVSDAGGTPHVLTHLQKGEPAHAYPAFLPDGHAVLFTIGLGFPARVAVVSLETGEQRDLVEGATSPHYSLSGHLVYAQAGGTRMANLMAVPFDAQRRMVAGAAVPVAQGVQVYASGAALYSLSDTGSLAYLTGWSGSPGRLVWVDRTGVEQPLPTPPRVYWFPRLSPAGQQVAVTVNGQEIWLCDLRRDTLTRLTFAGTSNRTGIWTPDGQRIAFLSNTEGPQNVFWQRADGSGGLERLTTSQYTQAPSSWSPDGQALAFLQVSGTATGFDIWVLRMDDRKAEPFLQTPFGETAPIFSPDGHWLAYMSNESGRPEIYVQPYPGPGGKYQISTDGGTEAVWNRNGRELFYRHGDQMMAVEVATQPGFSVSKPSMLFAGYYLPTPQTFANYDVSADGQRFLMVKAAGQAQTSPRVNVVLNWTEELKRLVPRN